MSAMPSAVQADFPAGSAPMHGSVDPSLNPIYLEDNPPREEPERAGGGLFGFLRFLVTFGVGVAATVGWYSYGDAAREAVAGMSPQFAWVAPSAFSASAPDPAASSAPSIDQQISAASLDIDAVRQNVDRIAASQEQIQRSIEQLSAGQEQLTKEIAKLQAVEQYILYKNSEPPAARPTPPSAAPTRRSAPSVQPSAPAVAPPPPQPPVVR
jgi:hypothetical protein